MIRLTRKLENGNYDADITREELLNIIGQLEDKGEIRFTSIKEGDTVYSFYFSNEEDDFLPLKWRVTKILSNKKDGVRFNVINEKGLTNQLSASFAYASEAEVFEKIAQRKIDIAKANRSLQFTQKLRKPYDDCTITLDIAQTDEEKEFLSEAIKEFNYYADRGYISHIWDIYHRVHDSWTAKKLTGIKSTYCPSYKYVLEELNKAKSANHFASIIGKKPVIPDIGFLEKFVEEFRIYLENLDKGDKSTD